MIGSGLPAGFASHVLPDEIDCEAMMFDCFAWSIWAWAHGDNVLTTFLATCAASRGWEARSYRLAPNLKQEFGS